MAIVFTDGFDKYPYVLNLFDGEWTGTASTDQQNSTSIDFIDGLVGSDGKAIRLNPGSVSDTHIYKTLPSTYSRLIVGYRLQIISWASTNLCAFTFLDGTSYQVSIVINGSGQIVVNRGHPESGTALGTSAESLTSNSIHYIEADVTFDGAAGAFTVWLDGVQVLNVSGVDTTNTANNSADGIGLYVPETSGAFTQSTAAWDDLYVLDTTGSAPLNARLGQPRIETVFPSSDQSIQFTMGTKYIGAPYNNNNESSMGGANRLVLRKFDSPVTGNLQNLEILPGSTNGTVSVKGVVYADNGSGTAPSGAPLATGDTVVGVTDSTVKTLTLPSALAVTIGTTYWVGYHTNGSFNIFLNDALNNGYAATATALPNPASSATLSVSQPSAEIWGNITGATTNYTEVNFNPEDIVGGVDTIYDSDLIGDLSYVFSTTVGNQDLYGHPGIVGNPTGIFTVAVKAYTKKDDAGSRTVDLVCLSSGSTGYGSATGQALAESYIYKTSYFNNDPATATTATGWTTAGLNASNFGIRVAS